MHVTPRLSATRKWSLFFQSEKAVVIALLTPHTACIRIRIDKYKSTYNNQCKYDVNRSKCKVTLEFKMHAWPQASNASSP